MWITQALHGGPGCLLRTLFPRLLAGASTNLANVWRPVSGGPGRLRPRTPIREQPRLRRGDKRQGTEQATQQEKEKDAALTRALEEKRKIEERTDAALTRALEDKDARIQEKEAALTRALEDKVARLQEKDAALTRALEDKEALLKSVREQLGEKLNDTVYELSRHRAVMANRLILEIGLRKYHEKCEAEGKDQGDFVFSRAWARFQELELQFEKGKWDVPKDVLGDLRALGCDHCVDLIRKEFINFVHTFSVPHHRLLLHPDPGFYIGGNAKAQRCAVAIAVLHLQKLGCLTGGVRYLDSDGKELNLLRRGHVLPPV